MAGSVWYHDNSLLLTVFEQCQQFPGVGGTGGLFGHWRGTKLSGTSLSCRRKRSLVRLYVSVQSTQMRYDLSNLLEEEGMLSLSALAFFLLY